MSKSKDKMSDQEVGIALMFIGAIILFFGFIFTTPNIFSEVGDNPEVFYGIGWGAVFIGFPLLIFGMAYPYLETWKKSKL